jgi:hypothetical protein
MGGSGGIAPLFLTSALDGDECSVLRSGCFTSEVSIVVSIKCIPEVIGSLLKGLSTILIFCNFYIIVIIITINIITNIIIIFIATITFIIIITVVLFIRLMN